MKKTLPTAKPNQLPVSRKFYGELRERVYMSCAIARKGTQKADEVMEIIDSYLAGQTMPENCADKDVMLILSLMKPEIDRAMKRSAAARGRSRKSRTSGPACRIENHDESASVSADAKTEPEASEDLQPVNRMNRRQRRRYEQEQRRLARRMAARESARPSKKQTGVAV